MAELAAPGLMSVRDVLQVQPDSFKLADVDPGQVLPGAHRLDEDPEARKQLEDAACGLQERLFAEARAGRDRRLVIVLQGMDTAGKGGASKAIDRLFDPLGFTVSSLGKPTEEELAHHFLWRIERKLPPAGCVGLFDRSHYEDVLIVRVHDLVPRDVWGARYDEINEWERAWSERGVTFLKCMLHISFEEQHDRLLARLDNPTKHWKYNPADIDERAHWDDYQAAYQVMLTRCSTDVAPWYVIPADRKWQRNWVLTHLVVETLRDLDPHYPPATFDVAAERARL